MRDIADVLGEKSIVGIEKVDNVLDKDEIQTQLVNLLTYMEKIGEINIPLKARILIKPNICAVKGYETGATVDPFLVECLINWLKDNHDIDSIVIAEADATALNVEVAFKVLGWETLASKYPNVTLLNITEDELVKIQLNGLYFDELSVSKTYLEADYLISFAKLKTHTLTGITCNLKNLYGANPIKYKLQYHKVLNNVICDCTKVRTPDLCIVDGIIAMEGLGPVGGKPKPLGVVLVGNDVVSTDHVCAKIMGFDPKKVTHINLAAKCRLGKLNYQTFGKEIRDVRQKFEFIPLWRRVIEGVYQSRHICAIPLWKKLCIKILGE